MHASTQVSQRHLVESMLGDAMRACLEGGSEAHAGVAYEIGRSAIAAGISIPDIIAHCGDTLRTSLKAGKLPQVCEPVLERADVFLAECLAPYEMSHRGYQESIDTLRHVNDMLEREAQRIAHSLHDQAGQLMVSVHLALRALNSEVGPASRPRIGEIELLLQQVEAQLRDLSHELVPAVLADLGWYAALEYLADVVSRRHGVIIALSAHDRHRLDPSLEAALYRVVQEALMNAVRHSGAARIEVSVRRQADRVRCIVSDDGRGFVPGTASKSGGLGLRAMRERVNALNGSLQVGSAPGKGTRIEIQLPVAVR